MSEQATIMAMNDIDDDPAFRFVFEEPSLATDKVTSTLKVGGLCACIGYSVNFDALVDRIRTSPTIRAIILLFHSFKHLQDKMRLCHPSLDPAAERVNPVLVYMNDEGDGAIGVDLLTLAPNGTCPFSSSAVLSMFNGSKRCTLKRPTTR